MIILNTGNPEALWQKIRTATREHRIEDLEPLGSERLALMHWPTRHVRLRLHVSVNKYENRIVILEQNGDLDCSNSSRIQLQKMLMNRLQELFPHDIEAASIVRLSSPFFSQSWATTER